LAGAAFFAGAGGVFAAVFFAGAFLTGAFLIVDGFSADAAFFAAAFAGAAFFAAAALDGALDGAFAAVALAVALDWALAGAFFAVVDAVEVDFFVGTAVSLAGRVRGDFAGPGAGADAFAGRFAAGEGVVFLAAAADRAGALADFVARFPAGAFSPPRAPLPLTTALAMAFAAADAVFFNAAMIPLTRPGPTVQIDVADSTGDVWWCTPAMEPVR